MRLLLRNGRLIDPASARDAELDLLIDDGKIQRIDRKIDAGDARELDLKGQVVCPGFLDMHVHLREPGQEWKETVESGTRSAAAGGFTAVACMPNTVPVNDCRAVTELIMSQAETHGHVEVLPIGCVTRGQQGEELAEMQDMLEAGACAFSDDGKPIFSSLMMRKALEYSRIFDVPIIDHCEDSCLVDGGVVHEGEISMRLGLPGWPGVAEDIMVQRDILLAEYTRGRVHIAHTSTARALEFVRWGKERKIQVTCEVTPHHFALTDHAVGEYDTDAKMNPPLRSEEDRQGILAGLADGTVDAIATDHAPHHCDEKCVEFANAPFGIVGLETAVSLCLDRLVHAGIIDLNRMIELFTSGPARVLGLDRPGLIEGAPANITVLDTQRQVRVDPERFESKSSNMPFQGWELRGAPVMTVVKGKIVHDGRGPARGESQG